MKADSGFARIGDLDVLAKKYVGSGLSAYSCVRKPAFVLCTALHTVSEVCAENDIYVQSNQFINIVVIDSHRGLCMFINMDDMPGR